MLGWFRGAPAETPRKKDVPANEEYDDNYVSETPAHMFAVKAFRTAIFGTPAPAPRQPRLHAEPSTQTQPNEKGKQPERIARETSKNTRSKPEGGAKTVRIEPQESKDASVLEPHSPTPFKLTSKTNLFDGTSASSSTALPASLAELTPARPSSPTKSILVAPGTARNKKAVTFHPSTTDEVAKPQNGRIRSGLPHEFPGKFPSPWTPKVVRPSSSSSLTGSLEETSKPISQGHSKRQLVFEVDEGSRIEDILGEPDHDEEQIQRIEEIDLTVDMAAPKSASGQYWKEHAEDLEGLALTKLDRMRETRDIAVSYAQKKDALCVDLAEKLREVEAKNQRLKDELKRIHGSGSSNSGNHIPVSNAMQASERDGIIQEMEQMQQAIEQYQTQVQTYKEIIDSREEKLTELSMQMFADEDVDLKETVKELERKLRRARQDLKDANLVARPHLDLSAKLTRLEKEKKSLEMQVERLMDIGSSPAQSTTKPSVESNMKSQIAELEKEKRDLRAELMAKKREASRQMREAEKAFRADMTNMKAKLVSVELDKKEMEHQVTKLQQAVTLLEAAPTAGFDEEWQTKHRTTLQDLRRAREECSALRQQKEEADEEIRTLRKQLGVPSVEESQMLPELLAPMTIITPGSLEEAKDHGSDDSAIDRSYDRSPIKRTTDRSTRNRSRSRSPSTRKREPSATQLRFSPSTPQAATQAPGEEESSPFDMNLPDPPELTPVQAPQENIKPTQVSEKTFDNSSFTRQRQAKASPRASMVMLSSTPLAGARRVSGARALGGNRRPTASGAGRLAKMDPARLAAAEKRIAERKKAKMAAMGA